MKKKKNNTMLNFKKILDLCKKTGYLTPNGTGLLGAQLAENLRVEWLNNCLNERGVNTFLAAPGKLEESIEYARKLCGERESFSLAYITSHLNPDCFSLNNMEDIPCFVKEQQLLLKTYTFVSPSNAQQVFYSQQKQRRIWWRKISADPSRYALTDMQTDDSNREKVQIISKYTWSTNIIEEVSKEPPNSIPEIIIKDGRKKVHACCITSTSHLIPMLLNILSDSYDVDDGIGKGKRELFRLHRCLAPLKIGIVMSGKVEEDGSDDIKDLAKYICNKLRKIGVKVLVSANNGSVENQFHQNDQLGIPYTVLLNAATLKNGITHLRNRDTTLNEQVHVGQLIQYVVQLLKNY